MGGGLVEPLTSYLDTQTAVWLAQADFASISPRAKKQIAKSTLLISPMVMLELQYLFEIKRSLAFSKLRSTLSRSAITLIFLAPLPAFSQTKSQRAWVESLRGKDYAFLSKDKNFQRELTLLTPNSLFRGNSPDLKSAYSEFRTTLYGPPGEVSIDQGRYVFSSVCDPEKHCDGTAVVWFDVKTGHGVFGLVKVFESSIYLFSSNIKWNEIPDEFTAAFARWLSIHYNWGCRQDGLENDTKKSDFANHVTFVSPTLAPHAIPPLQCD